MDAFRIDLRLICLQATGWSAVQSLLRSPGKLVVLIDCLLQCFAYETAGASLLLFASSASNTYGIARNPAAETSVSALSRS